MLYEFRRCRSRFPINAAVSQVLRSSSVSEKAPGGVTVSLGAPIPLSELGYIAVRAIRSISVICCVEHGLGGARSVICNRHELV